MVIKATSLSEVSEIAMVPDRECRMPTLMVSCAWAPGSHAADKASMPPARANRLSTVLRFMTSLHKGKDEPETGGACCVTRCRAGSAPGALDTCLYTSAFKQVPCHVVPRGPAVPRALAKQG